MYSVLIADDEKIIRQGLHYIIDWKQAGFDIIGEASDGTQALDLILKKEPDVVLLDIKMPGLSGLEVIRRAREAHYPGKVIILSGYSDFKFAQEAIRYDVKFYLTKPIDEAELESDLKELYVQLDEERQQKRTILQQNEKLRQNILYELLTQGGPLSSGDLELLNFHSDVYKVVLYEKFSHSIADISYNLPSMLRVSNQNHTDFETLTIHNNEVIILKGSFALSQFDRFVERINQEQSLQKGSPLDSLFLTCGRSVNDLYQIAWSYKEALQLMERRFFCKANQHSIDYRALPEEGRFQNFLPEELLETYCSAFTTAVLTHNPSSIRLTLEKLEGDLYYSSRSIADLKIFLADLFIRIKEQISFKLYPASVELPGNTQIIEFIQNRYYLYQILHFYEENLLVILKTLKSSSSDTIADEVADYIRHNYMENLKLESLAALFGYNSSYLGKVFTSHMGVNFNAYLDQVRVNRAKQLLETTELKVYEIAAQVGYRNVDALHEKFRKITGMSPAEYKKRFRNGKKTDQ
ncbi:MAG: response regulator transcription factor [Lachnospiraceae bacterium]|nr:response regulator transcription factor [Lachnospiraceae bacterium]